jgi:hypothetical protein
MPSVPKYQPNQVKESALPNARVNLNASLESFGGGQSAQNLQNTIQGVNRAAQDLISKELENADRLRVLKAEDEVAKIKTMLMYDKDQGFMNKKGEDAFGVPDEYGKRFDDELKRIESGLSNERQRSLFQERTSSHKRSLGDQLQQHVFAETKQYDEQVTKSRLSTAQEEAVLNYQNPQIVAEALAIQDQTIREHADRNGLPPEAVEQFTREAASTTHSRVIDRMLNTGSDIHAKKYFEAHKDQFTAKDAVAIEKALEEGSIRGESQRLSDQIMKTHGTMTSALEEAKKVEDPKLRDALVARVRDEFQLKKIAEDQRKEKLFENAANVIEKNGGDRDKIPPGVWAALSLQDRKAIDARARQLREGTPPTTEWGQFYELKTIASDPATRGEFLRTNLMTMRHQLADPEFKELVNLQTSLRNGDDDAEAKLGEFRTANQVIKESLAAMDIDPTPEPGTKDAMKVAEFTRMVQEEANSLQRQSGKKVTSEQIQDISNKLLIKGTVKGSGVFGFFQKQKHAFEAGSDDQLVYDIKSMPMSEVKKIQDSLRRAGRKVDDAAVVDVFNRAMLQKKR